VTEVTHDADPPDLVEALNALFENRIPAMHRLGIRIVELREDFVAGTAPLAGNLNYQDSMCAGTLAFHHRDRFRGERHTTERMIP
jgi:hypothetical protein